jgi:hypothetical protein
VGDQTPTCAICRSNFSGLDLFLTTNPGFGLLWLGGGRSGSVVSPSGAGSLGVGSSEAGGSGAGAAAAGFDLCLISLADLMKQTVMLLHKSR